VLEGAVNAEKILEKTKKPVIVVNKAAKEKGAWRKGEKARVDLILKFMDAGARYADIGIHTDASLIGKIAAKKNRTLIISYHDFKKTPPLATLKKIRDRAFALGADIAKIVTTAVKDGDNKTILELLKDCRARRKKCIAFCMGRKGVKSRLLAPRYGSYIMYVALDPAHRTAPGQLTLAQYRKSLHPKKK
jgi:3-dehydroquinate dehydratase type I